ncbi:hypothetical protein A1Q2_01412 [Trichosporon asahii var. asahii CBS 8904]|uniref:Uncharacterized protein n=1 Tax=Trichosporon asahii var. asahii (strain CBS 8904) TaxID=1220162 RepID=K1VV27_TRIAC|nr:hypothetical protein A1Q2_01412 [Trichosporon asahii var. asahii CBS 8904]
MSLPWPASSLSLSSVAALLLVFLISYFLFKTQLFHSQRNMPGDKNEQQGAWRPGLAESLTTDFVAKYKQLQAELEELRDAKEQADKYQKLYEESQAEIKELLGEM